MVLRIHIHAQKVLYPLSHLLNPNFTFKRYLCRELLSLLANKGPFDLAFNIGRKWQYIFEVPYDRKDLRHSVTESSLGTIFPFLVFVITHVRLPSNDMKLDQADA